MGMAGYREYFLVSLITFWNTVHDWLYTTHGQVDNQPVTKEEADHALAPWRELVMGTNIAKKSWEGSFLNRPRLENTKYGKENPDKLRE